MCGCQHDLLHREAADARRKLAETQKLLALHKVRFCNNQSELRLHLFFHGRTRSSNLVVARRGRSFLGGYKMAVGERRQKGV